MVLARCMQINGGGHVYSLEHDPIFAAKTRTELARHGLADWATVLDAPLVTHRLAGGSWPWYDITDLPEQAIDLLVIDGPPYSTHTLARYPGGPVLFPRLAAGASVFMDDAAREAEQEILRLWSAEFPDWKQENIHLEKGGMQIRRSR